ncbi:MAG: NADH-quinone oxidoreductase subunit K [Defluviitaleaceae bacterium]|nr:NADH-quinone oxidoreductase subunit K [Defluviitaleaceae bacterium]
MDISLFAVGLFFIGLFGIFVSNNIIKSIVFVIILQASIVMFWLMIGVSGNVMPEPPIIYDVAILEDLDRIADPLPQAITITTIIIGFSVVAIVITMLNTLYRQYGTTDWKTMEELATGGDE